mmetsp:Transcript_47168/g.75029  ORF Transcript_47168/g.75029 Transcript_47168/m.75029 type:complete len:86 (-) Transcript_47168:486-743(-)
MVRPGPALAFAALLRSDVSEKPPKGTKRDLKFGKDELRDIPLFGLMRILTGLAKSRRTDSSGLLALPKLRVLDNRIMPSKLGALV